MIAKNNALRDFLGVTAWHKAGYTGAVKVASGEDFLTASTDDHAFKSLAAFREIAPDAEVVYIPLGSDAESWERTANALQNVDVMFNSQATYAKETDIINKALQNVDCPIFVSAGNSGDEKFNWRMAADKIYGVGAFTLGWTQTKGGVPTADAEPIILPCDFSSTSEHVDFSAPTDVYIDAYTTFGGTSCACPVLAGMAALVQDFFIKKTRKPLSTAGMYRFLKDNTVDMETVGHDEKTGWGYVVLPSPESINILRYAEETLIIFEPDYEWLYELTDRAKTDMLVLHHAAIPTASAEQIHEYHQNSNGWNGIAYHYYIRKNGAIYRGRPENAVGGHTLHYNDTSIGVCFEGDFNSEEMSDAQVASGIALLADIRKRYPDIKIYKHSDLNATSCPGNNFRFEEVVYGMTYADFKMYMQRYEMEKQYEPVSEWAKETWEKAKDKGVFDGTMPKSPFTREQGAAVLDRLGLIK